MLLLLHGRDTFRSLGKLQEIISTYKKAHSGNAEVLNLFCDGLSIHELQMHLSGVSLFAKKRLIILKNLCSQKTLLSGLLGEAPRRPSSALGYGRAQQDSAGQASGILSSSGAVVVIWEAKDLGATKSEKELLSLANKKQHFPVLSGGEMRSFLAAFVKENHIGITNDAQNLLLAWGGGDSWFMANELRKLSSYKGGEVVEVEDVRALSSGNDFLNIFEMLKALFAGDAAKGLVLLHGLLNGGSGFAEVLYMMGREIRLLALAKEVLAQNKNATGIPGLSSFVAKKSLAQARRVSWEVLKDISYEAYKTDLAIKKGALDPLLGLELLSFRLTSNPSS